VSSQASLEKGFAEFTRDFAGKLDICVPCAGINRNIGFLDTSFEEHQKLLDVNVKGVYHTAQFAAKQMIANGTKKGSIVLVASIASYMAIRSQMSSAYCGTKGAVRAMVPGIAKELVQYVCVALVTHLKLADIRRESVSIQSPRDMFELR
jgi:NAD(P)-dependent dehydrogenase (short-subunit alcohol dehydrogenase family)